MKATSRFLTPAVWFLYVAIVFEFLFMITPFALYFYSAYVPALEWLNATALTSWLTAFFLPHFSKTGSPLLNGLNAAGWLFALAGLVLFLISAGQLYGAKLFRRGAVTGGFYRYIRHPQYLALGMLGLGMTLIWPRFIVLVSFVTMLFLYRLLAQIEEQRCAAKYGESYQRYCNETGMFLPRFRKGTPGLSKPQSGSKTALYFVAALILSLAIALVLREHMLSSVSAVYRDELVVLSPARIPAQQLTSAYELASEAAGVPALPGPENSPWLVYVVPAEWYMPDLPLDAHEAVRKRGGHGTPADFDASRLRVLIMQALSHAEAPTGRDIVRTAYGTRPLLIVDVDMAAGRVTGISEPPSGVIWGNMSPPLM